MAISLVIDRFPPVQCQVYGRGLNLSDPDVCVIKASADTQRVGLETSKF